MTVIDFATKAGTRWRINSTGWQLPEGTFEVCIEFEDGDEYPLKTRDRCLYEWAHDVMNADDESDGDDWWHDEPLPSMLTDETWQNEDPDSDQP